MFDNADVIIDTIDGQYNCYATGGIRCVTPGNYTSAGVTVIARTCTVPKASTVVELCAIPLKTFVHTGTPLKSIIFDDLTENFSKVNIKQANFEWMFGK